MSRPSLKSSQNGVARVVVSAARSRLLMQMENLMKSLSTIAVAVLLIATPACFAQQVVGSTKLGVAYAELRDVTTGWSTKRQVLGKNVFNDNGETIGKIDDIIVAPDKAVSYAVIGAGGFLGVGRHDVAIPVSQLKENGGKFILPGGSKDAIKALPEFEYVNNQ
jgi:sporulation protein YlmC with PRC-barrel domain